MARFKINRNIETEEKELFQVKLPKTLIEEVNLMVKWSANEKNFVVSEMFRYALRQENEFQAYKRSLVNANNSTSSGIHTAEINKKISVSDNKAAPAAIAVAK